MQMIFGQYSAGYSELLYAVFMDSDSVLYKVTVDWKASKETAHLPVIAQKFEVKKIDCGDGPVTLYKTISAELRPELCRYHWPRVSR